MYENLLSTIQRYKNSVEIKGFHRYIIKIFIFTHNCPSVLIIQGGKGIFKVLFASLHQKYCDVYVLDHIFKKE